MTNSIRTGSTIAVGDTIKQAGWPLRVVAIESRSDHSSIVRFSDRSTAVIGARHTVELVSA